MTVIRNRDIPRLDPPQGWTVAFSSSLLFDVLGNGGDGIVVGPGAEPAVARGVVDGEPAR